MLSSPDAADIVDGLAWGCNGLEVLVLGKWLENGYTEGHLTVRV